MGAATVLTTVGKQLVTGALMGGSPGSPAGGVFTLPLAKWVAWGTNAVHTAAVGDTALATEDSGGSPVYARQAGTGSQVTTTNTADTYQLQGTITSNGTKTIFEVGNFDASTSGNLMIYSTFASGIPLNLNDSITFKLQVQFT